MNLRTVWTTFFFGFLFFLPIQTVFLVREPFISGEKWQYGVIGIYATDILLSAALIVFFASRICSSPEFSWRKFPGRERFPEKMLLIFLGWAGLSVFWASDTILAAYFFLKLLLACGVFFLARSLDEKEAGRGIMILAAAALLQAGLAGWQFLSQTSFASTLLGMSAHESWVAGTSVLKNESGRWLRGYGTLPHPNILGGFIGAMLALTLGSRYFRLTAGTLLLAAILFSGLVFTFSRSAWLGVVMALFFLFLSLRRRKEGKKERELGVIFAFLLVVGMGLFLLVPETIAPRFESEALSRERSISDRIASFVDAKSLVASHPVFGVGIGGFTASVIQGGDPARPIWSIQPAHNVFLLVFAELGIIGLGFFVFFLLLLLKDLIRTRKEAGKNMAAFAVIALFPSMLLDHWLLTSHFGLFLLFFLFGLCLRGQKPLST